jgi:hypothetical protein
MKIVWVVTAFSMMGNVHGFAQIAGPSSTASGIGATSPLGIAPVPQALAPIGPVGIRLGATELASPGISPLVPDPLVMQSQSMACHTGALPGETGIASTSPFDGAEILPGMDTAATSPGSAGTCRTETPISSITPMAPPMGVPQARIPLGSTEIENGGVSPLFVVPSPSISDSLTEMPS